MKMENSQGCGIRMMTGEMSVYLVTRTIIIGTKLAKRGFTRTSRQVSAIVQSVTIGRKLSSIVLMASETGKGLKMALNRQRENMQQIGARRPMVDGCRHRSPAHTAEAARVAGGQSRQRPSRPGMGWFVGPLTPRVMSSANVIAHARAVTPMR